MAKRLTDAQKQHALDWLRGTYDGPELNAYARVAAHFPDWQEVLLSDAYLAGIAAERIDAVTHPDLAMMALETRSHVPAGAMAQRIDPVASPDLARFALELSDPPISCKVAEHIDPQASRDLAELALNGDACVARYVAEKIDLDASEDLAKLAFKVADRVAAEVASDRDPHGGYCQSLVRDAIRTGRAVAQKIEPDDPKHRSLVFLALRSPYDEIALPVAERIDPQKHTAFAKAALSRLKREDFGGGGVPVHYTVRAVVGNIDPALSPELARIVIESGVPELALMIAGNIDPGKSPELAKLLFNMPVTVKMPFLLTQDPARRDVIGRLRRDAIGAARVLVEKFDATTPTDVVEAALNTDDPELRNLVAARVGGERMTELRHVLGPYRVTSIETVPQVSQVLDGTARQARGLRVVA